MNTTVEFAVKLCDQECVQKVHAALNGRPGVSGFQVDLAKQCVIVNCSLPASQVQAILESTGKRAFIVGMGSTDSRGHSSLGAAVAMLSGATSSSTGFNLAGVVRFVQVDPDHCVIDGTIDGLTPGQHGLAIHECGDLSRSCESVGDHFNPRHTRHGSPQDNERERHVGDLGNVTADSLGRASFRLTDSLIKVSDVIGRSLVVSSDPDDLGRGSSPFSKINGNCGQKIGCGIIARSSGLLENPKRICACDGVTLWQERDLPKRQSTALP